MSEADMTNIIIAVVGVMSTVVGTVLGGLLTFYTARKNEHDKIIREKCEEIYDVLPITHRLTSTMLSL